MEELKLVLILVVSILLIVFLIAKLKIHAFLSLSLAGVFVALTTGIPLDKIGSILEKGVGGTLGFLAIIIGCGAILGKMLEISGGATRIALTLLDLLGKKRADMVMMFVGFIAGIPVFVEVGFVLLVPLALVVAKELGLSRIKLGIALATSLMCVHCILPPHPAATTIVATLGANIGVVILLGLCVGLIASFVGSILWLRFLKAQNEKLENLRSSSVAIDKADLPSNLSTFFVILLPLVLMLLKTLLNSLSLNENLMGFISFISNPIIALLISVFVAYYLLGLRRNLTLAKLNDLSADSFYSIAGVLLIIGAGGAFNEILVQSGVGNALKTILEHLSLNPIFLAWLVAIILHMAVGSATVSMISAAGIVAPLLDGGNVSKEVLCIAIGSGAIGLTIVTDSLFWLVKESLGMSVNQMFKYFTSATTIASFIGLGLAFGLSYVL